nr:amino acid synthesis family protein [Rhodobacter amnigenus]
MQSASPPQGRDSVPEVRIRKIATALEEIRHEGGPPAVQPLLRAAAMAVIENPFAGRYVADIQPFMEDLKPLGLDLARRLVAVLGGDPARVEGYGKGALVGSGGELEHGALWHAPGGYAMREVLGGAMAIVPSSKKVAGVGARLDVPVTHVNASYVRSHFDSMEVGLNDAPRADEMMVVLVMTTGPRVHNRAGGLAADQITGKDGLR